MRKRFLMLAAATVVLASCTQSEVLEIAQNRLISFDPFVENQTKATDDIVDGGNDFGEFYVFGKKETLNGGVYVPDAQLYLNHQKVTGGKGHWAYTPHVPWIADSQFKFAAYANGKGDGTSDAAKLTNVTFVDETSSGGKWGMDITDYTVGEKDLIVAVPGMKTIGSIETAPPSVGLTFKHILAKVIIQFRYNRDAGSNLVAEIEPFSFEAYKEGDCNVRYTGDETNTTIGATWPTASLNQLDDYEFFTVGTGENYISWAEGNMQQEVYVIPQSNAGIEIAQITLNTKNANGEVTSTVNFENVSLEITGHELWKPGYVYRYIADINAKEHYIHFTTSVNSWVDEDDRNQTMSSSTGI